MFQFDFYSLHVQIILFLLISFYIYLFFHFKTFLTNLSKDLTLKFNKHLVDLAEIDRYFVAQKKRCLLEQKKFLAEKNKNKRVYKVKKKNNSI